MCAVNGKEPFYHVEKVINPSFERIREFCATLLTLSVSTLVGYLTTTVAFRSLVWIFFFFYVIVNGINIT